MVILRYLSVFAVLVLAACAEPAPERDYKTEIDAVEADFAAQYSSGNVSGATAYYADEAVVMPPGYPAVYGHTEASEFWQSVYDSGVVGLSLTVEEVIGHGDSATERGSFVIFDAEGAELGSGKYLVFWVLADGHWKMKFDIWNLDI